MLEFEILTNVVEEVTGTKKEEIISKRRPRPLVELRMICSNVLKENHRKLSVEKIGALLNVDHATVTYHRKTHLNLLIQRDGKYKSLFEEINKRYQRKLMASGVTLKSELLQKRERLQSMLEDIDVVLKNLEAEESMN
jgi:hypothetical protein